MQQRHTNTTPRHVNQCRLVRCFPGPGPACTIAWTATNEAGKTHTHTTQHHGCSEIPKRDDQTIGTTAQTDKTRISCPNWRIDQTRQRNTQQRMAGCCSRKLHVPKFDVNRGQITHLQLLQGDRRAKSLWTRKRRTNGDCEHTEHLAVVCD